MRKLFIVLALTLTASAASAQMHGQEAQACDDPQATADATVTGCSAVIAAGKVKGADLAAVLNNRADGYMGLGKWDLAIADESKAIGLDAKNANAFNNRCMAYSGKAQYAKAVEDCSAAIRLNPTYGHYYRNRARAYLKMNKRQEALADFRLAIKYDPHDAFAMQGMIDMAARDSGTAHQGEMPDKMKKALGIQTVPGTPTTTPAAKASP